MFEVGDEVVTTNGDLGTVILVSHSAAQVRYKSGVVDAVKLTELTKVYNMFKVGDEVIVQNSNVATILGLAGNMAYLFFDDGSHGDIELTELKPRFEVKYLVVDNSDRGEKSPLFNTEQQAFDYINKQRVNIGERWKHSDGTIVEVVNVDDRVVNFKFSSIGVEHEVGRFIHDFIKVFTKCES